MAENAAHTLHNILTLRGALVRDPRVWAHYLNETIELFGARTDVLFASHHWPRWGSERIVDFLEQAARPLRATSTTRRCGCSTRATPARRSPSASSCRRASRGQWHCRGYYGSVSHNVKAVYQRYMGWFDGNPAHLWEHPPVEAARRYVEFMGGADAVLEKARASFDEGDYRWVAEVVNHVVFAEPDNAAARELQADGARAARLRGRERDLAQLLPDRGEGAARGRRRNPDRRRAADIIGRLSLAQLFDSLAIRIDGPRAWERADRLDRHRPRRGARDHARERRAQLPGRQAQRGRRGIDHLRPQRPRSDAARIGNRGDLAGALQIEGDGAKLATLFGLLDHPIPTSTSSPRRWRVPLPKTRGRSRA